MRIVRLAAVPPADLAAFSRNALDRPLHASAELVVAVPSSEAVVLGSMQRVSELGASLLDPDVLVTRRGSGGAECRIGPGTVWMQLALSSSDALVACEPGRLCNRYVRPLLRALAKVGAVAHYFDRDWVSASKSPVASVSFAHDTQSGRAMVEAIIAVHTPFALRARSSYLGKPARTLHDLGVAIEPSRLAEAVVEAYAKAYGAREPSPEELAVGAADDPRGDPPWASMREEAIGVVAAGRDRDGRMRVGGELMVSRDAIARLEDAIARAPGDSAELDRAVDELAAPGVALLGVRDLRSLREVIAEALEKVAQ
jgi:lipoate-protein ligase A